MQYSHARYLQAAFHENWLDTKGSSCKIVSPFLKFTVENNARPYKNNSNAHAIIVIHTFLPIFDYNSQQTLPGTLRISYPTIFLAQMSAIESIIWAANSFVLYKTRG